MANSKNKNSGSNKIAVMRDILKTVAGVTEFAEELAKELGLTNEPEQVPLKKKDKVSDDVLDFLEYYVDDVKTHYRRKQDEKTLAKSRQIQSHIHGKYDDQINQLHNKPKEKVAKNQAEKSVMISNLDDHLGSDNIIEVQPVADHSAVLVFSNSPSAVRDKVVFPESQEPNEVLVQGLKGIERHTINLPQNFAGLKPRQPLTEEQFGILDALHTLNSINLRLQRPALYYKIQKTKQSRKLLLEDQAVQKRKLDEQRDKRGSPEVLQILGGCLREQNRIVNELNLLVTADNEDTQRFDKALPVPTSVFADAVPAQLRVSSYHTEALANGEFSTEQAEEYRMLSEDELLKVRNKIALEEENLHQLLDYLQVIPEDQNPFNLGDNKELAEAYKDAVSKLIPQAQKSVATAKLLCDIEMAYRHNENDAVHQQAIKLDAKLDSLYVSARTRAETLGSRSLRPDGKEAFIRHIDTEIQKIESRKNGIRFKLGLVLKSTRLELREQEKILREFKKTVEAATEKTPAIQSLVGDGILGHAQIRTRFITALKNKKYSEGVIENVDGQADPNKLQDLCRLLQNKKTDPVLLDGKILEFVARSNGTHLQRYFEKLLDGMIAEIKAENAKLWKIRKFLTGRDKKDQALIKHLEILKARLGGGNSLLLVAPNVKVTQATFTEKNLIVLQKNKDNEVFASVLNNSKIDTTKLSNEQLFNIKANNLGFPTAKKPLSLKIVHSSKPELVDAVSQLCNFVPAGAAKDDKALDFIEIYQTPEIAPIIKAFNKKQRKVNGPSFVRLPRLESIANYQRDKSSPLYKLLQRSAVFNSVTYLFRQSFVNLLGLPGDATNEDVVKLLTMPDHQALEKLIRIISKKLNEGAYTPLLNDQTKVSFEYLVKQMMSALRAGLSTRMIDAYERQKYLGDIEAIKQSGRLEAESPLMDLVFDHPHSPDNKLALIAEITRIRNKLQGEKGENIQNVLKGLVILESFVDGTRQGLLSDVEKTLLRNVLPEYRLKHTHAGIEHANDSIETYLVKKHIKPAFADLTKTYGEKIQDNAVLQAGADFKRCKGYVELIKAYALDQEYAQNKWFSHNNQSIKNVFPEFRASFIKDSDIDDFDVNKHSTAYLTTASDNNSNIRFHFFVNAYLFGFGPAFVERLSQYGFPKVSADFSGIDLTNSQVIKGTLRNKHKIVDFVKTQISSFSNELLNKLPPSDMSLADKTAVLLDAFFTRDLFSLESLVEINDSTWENFVALQTVFQSAIDDFSDILRRMSLENEQLLLFKPEVHLNKGLLIRNIGTDAQAHAYLTKRLPFVVLNDRIDADVKDEIFLSHQETKKSNACQTLIAETVKVFVDAVTEFPAEASDKTETFIASFAPQYLAAYQYKRLLNLLQQLSDAHHEMCRLQKAGENADHICKTVNLYSKTFEQYLNELKVSQKADSLFFSMSSDASLLRADLAKTLQGFVNVQNQNMFAVISVKNEKNAVVFENYLGNYVIFPVPGHGIHAKLGAAIESLIYAPNLNNEESLIEHQLHKLSTLLEMSFLFDDAERHGLAIKQQDRVALGDDPSSAQDVEFASNQYSLEKDIKQYLRSLPDNLKDNPIFQLFFIRKLEDHLCELENKERPLSITAELFFRRFGTQDQCDRFRLCYIEDLLARGQAMRANVSTLKELENIDASILTELETLLAEEPTSRENKYLPQFFASTFIKGAIYREKLDVMLQTYHDNRVKKSQRIIAQAAQEGIDLNASENQNVDALHEILPEPLVFINETVNEYAPINTMVWKIGEELASKDHVRTTRFALLEEYLARSAGLPIGTAEAFINNFVNRPLDGMIDSEKANEFSLAYIEAIEQGNLRNYNEAAQQEAERLIAFFSPNLVHKLFYAKLAKLFKDGVHTAAQLAGGAINVILECLSHIITWAAEAFSRVLQDMAQGLGEFLATLIDLVKAKAIQFEQWLSTPTNTEFKQKRNFLLDYLCQGFVNRGGGDIAPELIEDDGLIRMLLASQTFDRADKSKPTPDASKLTHLLLGQGLNNGQVRCSIDFDRFEETEKQLKDTFAWFCALDSEGYYSSAFALLHIAQLCRNNVNEASLNERISHLTWMSNYKFKIQNSDAQFKFLHQAEADHLFRASPFFKNENVAHNANFARLLDLYASPELADAYRLKKVKELIEASVINADKVKDAEDFINKLAFYNDYYKYMTTPEGAKNLVDYLNECLDNNVRWSPTVSVFIDSFVDTAIAKGDEASEKRQALKQKNNLQRISGIIHGKYNEHSKIDVLNAGRARYVRDDYDAFPFLAESDSALAAKKIAQLFGDDVSVINAFSAMLDDLLRVHLTNDGKVYEKLTEIAAQQLKANGDIKPFFPDYFLNELSKLYNNTKVVNLDLGRKLGQKVEGDLQRDEIQLDSAADAFLQQILNQFSIYLENSHYLKNDQALKNLDPEIQLKLQKISLLRSAFTRQKDIYNISKSITTPEKGKPETFSLLDDSTDVAGCTLELKNRIEALNDNGGGNLYDRLHQAKAELDAQQFLSVMDERIIQQLNQTVIDDLAPYQVVDLSDLDENNDALEFSNKLGGTLTKLAEVKYDATSKQGFLLSCDELFLTVKRELGERAISEQNRKEYDLVGKITNKVVGVFDQINLVSKKKPAPGKKTNALLLSELSPILMSPLFGKQYNRGLLAQGDEEKLAGYLESYRDAVHDLMSLKSGGSVNAQKALIRKMLEAFVDIVSLHFKDVSEENVAKLKDLLEQQYPDENTVIHKYIPIKKQNAKLSVSNGLERIFSNIISEYKEKLSTKQPLSGRDIQGFVRENLAQFSIVQGSYQDMQKGIDIQIRQTRKQIFSDASKGKAATISESVVDGLQKLLERLKREYLSEKFNNASYGQLLQITDHLSDGRNLKLVLADFIAQIEQMKTNLSADLSSTNFPYFDFSTRDLALLQRILTPANRETLAILIDNLPVSSAGIFVVTDEMSQQLKFISEYLQGPVVAVSEQFKQLNKAIRENVLKREETYKKFVNFFNEPETWTAENIKVIFSELRELKDAQLVYLIELQFKSKLGSGKYEEEKLSNPYFMSYKALTHVADLFFSTELVTAEQQEVVLNNVVIFKNIAMTESKVQAIFARSANVDSKNLSGLVADLRKQVGIQIPREGRVVYRPPFKSEFKSINDIQDVEVISRVFCADLLQAQFKAFSEVYASLVQMKQQGQKQQQLQALQNMLKKSFNSIEELASAVLKLENSFNLDFTSFMKELGEIKERNSTDAGNSQTKLQAIRLGMAQSALQKALTKKFEKISEHLKHDPLKDELEPNFSAAYQRYSEVTEIINQIEKENQVLQSQQGLIPQNRLKMAQERPVQHDMSEEFLYLYLDNQNRLVYEFADRDNSQIFKQVVVNPAQLGIEYYDSIVTSLEKMSLDNNNANSQIKPAEFNENTMLALMHIIPQYDYYVPDHCPGKWVLFTNKVGEYDANTHLEKSISACLSNYTAHAVEILDSIQLKAYLRASAEKASTSEIALQSHIEFMTKVNKFKDNICHSAAGKVAEKALSGSKLSGSGQPITPSTNSQPINTPVLRGLLNGLDQYKNVIGADPSKASTNFNTLGRSLSNAGDLESFKQITQKSQKQSAPNLLQKLSSHTDEKVRAIQAEQLRMQQEAEEENMRQALLASAIQAEDEEMQVAKIVIPSSQPTPTPSSSQSQRGNPAHGKQQVQSECDMTKTPSHKIAPSFKVPAPKLGPSVKKVPVSVSVPGTKSVGFGGNEKIISNNPVEQAEKNKRDVKPQQRFFAKVEHKGRDVSSRSLIGAGRSKPEENADRLLVQKKEELAVKKEAPSFLRKKGKSVKGSRNNGKENSVFDFFEDDLDSESDSDSSTAPNTDKWGRAG